MSGVPLTLSKWDFPENLTVWGAFDAILVEFLRSGVSLTLIQANFIEDWFQMGVNLRAEEMLDQKYFLYVSGAQIDRNGNVIIADAKNHHFKLFKPAPAAMTFVSRVATDFPVPYVSSFHVNKKGEVRNFRFWRVLRSKMTQNSEKMKSRRWLWRKIAKSGLENSGFGFLGHSIPPLNSRNLKIILDSWESQLSDGLSHMD